MPYQIPASDIVSIIDAPPTPAASLAPGRRFIALVHYESHPPVAHLARPYLALAGLRLRHPQADEQELRVRLTVRLYGRAAGVRLFGSVPDDAL